MAVLIAVMLVIGLVPVSMAAGYNVKLTKYDSDWTTVTDRPVMYQTVKEAIDAVNNNEYAEIIFTDATDELTTITMNQTGASIKLQGSSGIELKAPIVMRGSGNVLQMTNVKMNCSSTALSISAGKLYLETGTSISGANAGVVNNGGTVYFHGGQVSSYRQNSGSRDGDISLIGSATPTPYPTATPTPGPHVYVTGIDGLPNAATMVVGETYQLRPTVRPTNATNQSVTWTSSNTNVATVDANGVIKAVGTGTTVLKATTLEGAYSDSCTLTVKAGTTPTPTITISPTPSQNLTVTQQIARSTDLYLDGSYISGTLSRSTSLIYVTPKQSKQYSENSFTLDVASLKRLSEDKYSAIRYRLPWILVDVYERMGRNLDDDEVLEITVQRLSASTMTKAMNTKWSSIQKKSITGPWEISSNSDTDGLYLRLKLPKYYSKSSLRLVKWNGSNFVDAGASTTWALVKIGSDYYLRSGRVTPGTYAVLQR